MEPGSRPRGLPVQDLLAGNGSGTIDYRFDGDAPPASDTLTLTVNDLGNSGSGGPASAADSATINLTAVNDPPVNTVPCAQTTNVNTALTFNAANGNLIGVADADAGGAILRVSLTIGNGTFTLASTGGLSFGSGDGVADAAMTFEGTAASINAALNGASFAPTAAYSGEATVALVTNDLGNTGGGALTDSDTIHIQVGASRFQEGSGGYAGTQDTYVQDTTPTTAYDPRVKFELLNDLCGVDYLEIDPKKVAKAGFEPHLEVVYHLSSFTFPGRRFKLKVMLPRWKDDKPGELPEVSTISEEWRTADWHEREVYDLSGVFFVGHPNLRRILCPEDWVGHPLRKDYEFPLEYLGVRGQ